ncbi:MAG: hypothetical protein D6725_12545 [Planctomycetota bacterium]|nr:MAG: hypothetical protein D6725_12545 [Planctomycetota bacterium]
MVSHGTGLWADDPVVGVGSARWLSRAGSQRWNGRHRKFGGCSTCPRGPSDCWHALARGGRHRPRVRGKRIGPSSRMGDVDRFGAARVVARKTSWKSGRNVETVCGFDTAGVRRLWQTIVCVGERLGEAGAGKRPLHRQRSIE